MGQSHIVQMPELSELNIPAKQYLIRLSDKTIFRALLEKTRRVAPREGPAEKGDYVLVCAELNRGGKHTLHIELGGRAYPDYEEALMGCRAGQEIGAVINGDDALLRVESVKKVVDMPLTDESVAALGLPGIHSLVDYRRRYITEHGGEHAERIFHAIQDGLLTQLDSLIQADLDPEEVEHFHRRQRVMIQNISGDADQRLMDAYGCDTPEEADRMFAADNRRTFTLCLWGRALAERDGRTPDEAERKQAFEYYCLIYETNEDELIRHGLADEALQPFYIQYGIGVLRRYYQSLVCFSAGGIESQPL